MIDRNHPAVEAGARAALAKGWTCDTHEPEPWGSCPDCTASHLRTAPKVLTAALPHLTADDLRNTPAGRELMAEAWGKFQEHYADQWDEWYPEDIFPSPAPPPAVVSRESVAAFMMRHWAERLRADPNPYKETQ